MGTLVKIRDNTLTIKNQSNLLHQNSIRLHYWRKIENFMENLKIRKYPFFTLFDPKIIKIIQKDVHMEIYCKKVIETMK